MSYNYKQDLKPSRNTSIPNNLISNYKDLTLKDTELLDTESLEYKILICNGMKKVSDILMSTPDDFNSLRHLNSFPINTRFNLVQSLLGISDLIQIIFTSSELEHYYIRNYTESLEETYTPNWESFSLDYTFPFLIDFDAKIIRHYFREARAILPAIRVTQDESSRIIPLSRLGFTEAEMQYLRTPYHKSINTFIENNLERIRNEEYSEPDNTEGLALMQCKLEILSLYGQKHSKEYSEQEIFPKIKLKTLLQNPKTKKNSK